LEFFLFIKNDFCNFDFEFNKKQINGYLYENIAEKKMAILEYDSNINKFLISNNRKKDLSSSSTSLYAVSFAITSTTNCVHI